MDSSTYISMHIPQDYNASIVHVTSTACSSETRTLLLTRTTVCKCKKHQLRSTEMRASARNISCAVPRCLQVQETSVAQYRDVCKCKKHQLRSTEMCASATYVNIPPPHPPHPYQRRDVPRACVQVQETSVAQYRDVCKCKKHQLRSTEMCASATYVNIPPPPTPPTPPIPKNPLT